MNATAREWFVHSNGRVYGPASINALRKALAAHKVTAHTVVSRGKSGPRCELSTALSELGREVLPGVEAPSSVRVGELIRTSGQPIPPVAQEIIDVEWTKEPATNPKGTSGWHVLIWVCSLFLMALVGTIIRDLGKPKLNTAPPVANTPQLSQPVAFQEFQFDPVPNLEPIPPEEPPWTRVEPSVTRFYDGQVYLKVYNGSETVLRSLRFRVLAYEGGQLVGDRVFLSSGSWGNGFAPLSTTEADFETGFNLSRSGQVRVEVVGSEPR